MAEEGDQLPDDVIRWIAEETGGTVTATKRVPGGASREAWFIDVQRSDGTDWPLFLRYSRDERKAEAGGLYHPLRIEAEIFLALNDTELTVPRTLGVHPTRQAMLAERVPGETWFYRIKDPVEQVLVAQDFIRNLAALHRIDPTTLALPSLGPVRSAREHALDEIVNMRRRATGPDGAIDPLVRFCLDWLERNVPDYDGPVVFVQGDTGPGNFMYQDGKVTAVVDWELAHFGDPMDDIAWLSLRTVQDTFTHFPDRIREYEELSGHPVDVQRVWYYRLFAELRLASDGVGGGRAPFAQTADPNVPVNRDVGNGLIYGMLHRRLTLEALAAVMGLDLPEEAVPEGGQTQEWHGMYDVLLGSFQAIVPRIEDRLAAGWAKGAVRLVKLLKELDEHGPAFAAAEMDDLTALLGHRPATLAEGRKALAQASADGKVADVDYVGYAWRRVQRDNVLFRSASGALATRTWPPLRD